MTPRERLVLAADSLSNAVRGLPVQGYPREVVKSSLRKVDEAESELREAMDAYVSAAARGAKP